jgi:CRP/FNR family cyclic AMP-dependent transcriptional regulator
MKSFQHEEVIFRRGDPSECAYLIEAGQVEVLDADPGRPVRIALLGKGDIVGEMALIDERPRSITARAVGAVSLSTVSRDQFVKLMFNDPAEGLRYLRAFFERLRTMNARVAGLDSTGATQAPALRPAIRIRLVPLGAASELVLPAEGLVIESYPFRVGREPLKGKSRLSMNDLGLPDSEPFNVSREHFAIDREGDALVVYDRGSFLGTIVNGCQIGGRRPAGSAPLRAGTNEIIAGSPDSPFRFSIVTGKD